MNTRWSHSLGLQPRAHIRGLGGKRWRAVDRLIYWSGIAGVTDYLWLVKAQIREPLEYGAILAVFLASRRRKLAAGLIPPESVGVSRRSCACYLASPKQLSPR
jgi:DMSO/TMAO reductase YedYZ heme-binding membrane subunit